MAGGYLTGLDSDFALLTLLEGAATATGGAYYYAYVNRPSIGAMTSTTNLTDGSVGDTSTGHSNSDTDTASGCGTVNAIGVVTFAWAESQNCNVSAVRFTGRANATVPSLASQCLTGGPYIGYTSANFALEYSSDGSVWSTLTSGPVTNDLTYRNYTATGVFSARYVRGILLGQSYQEGVDSIVAGSYSGLGDVTDFRITYAAAPCSPPTTPTLTVGSLCSIGGVSLPLTWNDLTASYEVERRATTANVYSGTALSTTVTGLTAATTEYFRIRAMDSCGTGAWSTYVTGVPKTTVTGTPAPTGYLYCCGGGQSVTWAMVDNATSYRLYRRIDPSPAWGLATSGPGLTYSYSVPPGEQIYPHYYALVAVNECGDSATGGVTIGPLYTRETLSCATGTLETCATATFTFETCDTASWIYPSCNG